MCVISVGISWIGYPIPVTRCSDPDSWDLDPSSVPSIWWYFGYLRVYPAVPQIRGVFERIY